ncbi:oxidoreductase [Niveispirillum sp. BGYR6]|uniref:oxidoreductase n=1 Tax=Niveispirillum sp. BGYR6 TaxID=2971249 RepID=UPI0022B9503B|nr:oxidoreductase [Niveispirillum sp. BGYR6]
MPTITSAKSTASIAPPEPFLTPVELLRRARALRPLLRASQADCEAEGRVSAAINDRLVSEGFYRIVQPRRFGGYEFDIATFYKVIMEVSRGCTETGWVLSLVGGHPVLVSRYPLETQIELYGDTGELRCPGALTPPGRAVPVEGGYRVSGKWVSSSGIDIGTHFMGLANIVSEGEPTHLQVILDIDQCTIVDDWTVMGMRGTGSKRVDVEDLFVPHGRVLQVSGMARGAEPTGQDGVLFDNPMYSGRMSPFLIGETAAVAVGAARGALDHYEELLRTKKTPYPPYQEKYLDGISQHQYGTALAMISTAEAALVRSGEEYMEYARAWKEDGIPFDDNHELRLILITQRCIELAWDAIELIYRTAGTSASAKVGMPIGRILRNVAVLRTHPVLQHDQTVVRAARSSFGL